MSEALNVTRGRLVVLVLLLVTMTTVGVETGAGSAGAKTPDDVTMVTVRENGSTALWPYTSRGTQFESLTLPINVVVRAEPDLALAMLTREPASADLPSDATVRWRRTTGATRYTFVRTPDGRGIWTDEHSQLHVGTYFGSRQHVRLYEVPAETGDATAVQAHREHWDWFRLRHTVDSTAAGRAFVERQFYADGRVEAVRHERYANGGTLDADGWVSVVEVRPGADQGTGADASGDHNRTWPTVAGVLTAIGGVAVAGAGVGNVRNEVAAALDALGGDWRPAPNHVLLFGGIATLPVFVRVGSIAAEGWIHVVGPKPIAAGFYLLLVVGIPACAYRFAAGLEPTEGALAAILGFGGGVIADYTFLGVEVIPRYALVHRLALALALGIVAGAGAVRLERRWHENRLLGVGAVCWAVALALPLLGVL